MGLGVLHFVLVHIGICFAFAVFCCVWFWREKRASRTRRRRSEQAAERFFASLAESVNPSSTAARDASQPVVPDRPPIPFLAVLPDSTLILAVLDKDDQSTSTPPTPPSTLPRSHGSEATAPPSQSTQPIEPPSSSHIVYVPPPQPQYIPPDRPARYPIEPHSTPQPWLPPSHSSSTLSGRIRRIGLPRMQSFRRVDLEGIPGSLIWSIVTVDPQYCPWAHSASQLLGSSARLQARSRSFHAFYGAINLLRGDSASASRTAATQPFPDDSLSPAQAPRQPSQNSWTAMLGWRAPFLSGFDGEMAAARQEEAPGRGSGPAALTDTLNLDDNPPGHSRSAWLGGQDGSDTDALQAALSTPGLSVRDMSLGYPIQLRELAVRTRISEVDAESVDGIQ
eukprot:jgi/Ulvmu1/5540/UM023_0076.1